MHPIKQMLLVTICLSWYVNDTRAKVGSHFRFESITGAPSSGQAYLGFAPPASCYNSVRRTKHEIGFFQVNICLFYSSSLCRLSHEMVAPAASSILCYPGASSILSSASSSASCHRQYRISNIDGCYRRLHRHYRPYGFAISTLASK